MSTTLGSSEADILSRVVAPKEATLPIQIADMILGLHFPKEDRERMDVLAEKAQQGILTEEEQLEIDAYERVGHFLSLLQSKARASTKHDHSVG